MEKEFNELLELVKDYIEKREDYQKNDWSNRKNDAQYFAFMAMKEFVKKRCPENEE